MIFDLVGPYVSVAVIGLFWAVAIRPLLRLTHLSPRHASGGGALPRRRRRVPQRPRTRR